jgi:hypothetical protein
VNILNKQPLTVKSSHVTKDSYEPRTWTDSLDKRPKRPNVDMRFGMWNIRSIYWAGVPNDSFERTIQA